MSPDPMLEEVVAARTDPGLLSDLARLIRSVDPDDIIARSSRFAAAVVGARQAATSRASAVEGAEPSVAVFVAGEEGRIGPADAAIGRAVRAGSGVERWDDAALAADERYRDLLADARPPLRGLLAVPLLDRDAKSHGRIALSDPLEDDFGESHEALLLAVAEVVSAALERGRLQQRLEDAQQQRQAFFGVVSHELRTPITTIYGGIRMLDQAGTRLSHDTRAQLIEDITAESERLYRLVEDLLVLSRAERHALDVAAEPILLQHLLGRVVASEQQRAVTSRLRVDAGTDLPPVTGDATLVEQVVRNLLSNAIKYAGDAGPIEVVASSSADGWVEVRVADEGPGIDVGSVDHVFDLFYRAPDAPGRAQGAGIGLYVCDELIRAMDGEMWVRRRHPRGLEIGFRLRAYDDSLLD